MAKPAKKIATRTPKAQPKRGRPKVELNAVLVAQFASFGCSKEEIAAMLRQAGMQCSIDMIKRRLEEPEFRAIVQQGQDVGKAKLRSRMFMQAQLMNGAGVNQSQFLARNWLGMKGAERDDPTADPTKNPSELIDARDRVRAKLESLAKRLESGMAGEPIGQGTQPLLPQPTGDGSGGA